MMRSTDARVRDKKDGVLICNFSLLVFFGFIPCQFTCNSFNYFLVFCGISCTWVLTIFGEYLLKKVDFKTASQVAQDFSIHKRSYEEHMLRFKSWLQPVVSQVDQPASEPRDTLLVVFVCFLPHLRPHYICPHYPWNCNKIFSEKTLETLLES